jgi:hypothetical protein
MYTTSTIQTSTMEGHHKISISGVIFYVETDCKLMLLSHLNLLKKSFTTKSNPIFESPEEQLADLLLGELKGGKEIITCREVEALIQRMQVN